MNRSAVHHVVPHIWRVWLGITACMVVSATQAQTVVSGFDPHGGRNAPMQITGTGFTDASELSIGGVPVADFEVISDTQINALAPEAFVTGPVQVDGVPSTFHYISRTGAVSLSGPTGRSNLPLGVLHNYTPLADNAFGHMSGVTYSFEAMPLTSRTWVYYGIRDGVGISMDNNQPSGDELMIWSEVDSNVATGRVVFRGRSQMLLAAPWASGNQVCTRLVLMFSALPPSTMAPVLMPAASVGLPSGLGLVAAVPPGGNFRVNLRMEAAYRSGETCGSWQPALALYNNAPTYPGGVAHSTYGTGFYYENTAPELGDIADQFVADGHATSLLDWTVDDAETSADGVTLSVSSSNPALVPVENVSITSSGPTRQVTVQTVASIGGFSDITLRGTDSAGAFSETSFRVTTTHAPTITPIADLLIQQATPSDAITFTVGDDLTAVEDLIVTATSSNQTLIPDANLALSGTDAQRSLIVTPNGSQYGQATVTLTVTDAHGLSGVESFDVTVNARPILTSNVAPQIIQGDTMVFTTAHLNANDAESGPERIRFTLAPGGVGTAGRHGEVLLENSALGQGSTFTLQDIQTGKVAFRHDDTCTDFGEFNFDIDDMDGGFGRAPLSPYRAAISVVPRNDPPTADSMNLPVGLGGSASATLPGEDSDCRSDDVLVFSLVAGSEPTKGTITALDSATGTFTYTADAGTTGADEFTWQVSDGTHIASATVSVLIANQPPAPVAGTLTTTRGQPASGQVQAHDPDVPAQTLHYTVVDPPQKGSLTAFDPDTGAFTYEPAPHRIGFDSFRFIASDDELDSAPATFSIEIVPNVAVGDLAIGTYDDAEWEGAVVLIDPISGDQWPLSEGGYLQGSDRPMGLDFTRDGNLIVHTQLGKVLHVARADGTQTLLLDAGNNGVGLYVAPDGDIYAAGGPAGSVRRVDAQTGGLIDEHQGVSLTLPSDVDFLPDGRLVVTSAGAVFGGSNLLAALDWNTGTETDLGVTGLTLPMSVAVLPDGLVAIGDGAVSLGANAVDVSVKILDPADGSLIASFQHPALTDATGLAANNAGVLYSASQSSNSVLRHDRDSGGTEIVSTGDRMLAPWGIAVFNSQYTVTFVDWNGSALVTRTVDHGTAATAPADPIRTGYTFTGWDVPFDNVTSDFTVTAQYTLNHYTVTLAADPVSGGVLTAQASVDLGSVAYGTALALIATPNAGWDVADVTSFPPQLTCNGNTSDVSDANMQPDGSLSFTALITDHCTVTAYFANQAPGFLAGGKGINALVGGDEITELHWANALRSGDAVGEINQALAFDLTQVGTFPGHAQVFAPGGEPIIDAEGTLTFTPGPDTGTALFSVVLRDDAGTAWGGNDTSTVHLLMIRVMEMGTDLSIHPDVPATLNFPGDRIAFAITLHNAGPGDAEHATITWTPPLALEEVQWLCEAYGAATCTASGEDDISETISLPANGTLAFLIQATIAADAPAHITNIATVTPGPGQTDPDPSDDMATWDIAVDGVFQDGFE